ncbi:hypothetical protein AB9P05_22240 [Roseivirga sp. BDSF3-8]
MAREIKLDRRRPADVDTVVVLDSCMFLRKQLMTVGVEDSQQIPTTDPG